MPASSGDCSLCNGLTFSGVPTLLPLPSGVVKLVAQAALARRLRVGAAGESGPIGAPKPLSRAVQPPRVVEPRDERAARPRDRDACRDVRFAAFVAVLWLLTPLWGRRDMLVARWHVRCLSGGMRDGPVGPGHQPWRRVPRRSAVQQHLAESVDAGCALRGRAHRHGDRGVAQRRAQDASRPRDSSRRLGNHGSHPYPDRNDRSHRRRDRRDAQPRCGASPRPALPGRRCSSWPRSPPDRSAGWFPPGSTAANRPRSCPASPAVRRSGTRSWTSIARISSCGSVRGCRTSRFEGLPDRQLLVGRLPGARPRR